MFRSVKQALTSTISGVDAKSPDNLDKYEMAAYVNRCLPCEDTIICSRTDGAFADFGSRWAVSIVVQARQGIIDPASDEDRNILSTNMSCCKLILDAIS